MARSPKTQAIHAGTRLSSKARPVAPAIHVAAVSDFDDAELLDASFDGKDYVYTRIRGQNAELLEEAVAALEDAEACVAFATGMAALKAVFEAQSWKTGDALVIPMDGYGATQALYRALAEKHGVVVHALRLSDAAELNRLERLRPKLVVAESETNPLLSVPDMREVARASKAAGAKLAVDGTFVSPILQRSLLFGAEYAVQSTTKWINGHSDAMGGTVSGTAETITPLRKARVLDGAVLGPFEAWLTLRGVRTLPLRMAAHCEHALAVAKRLDGAPGIRRVLYPGLSSHPDHEVAKRMLSGGFGGMVAFEIEGADRAAAFAFLERVKLARPAPSLGDVTTLVMHPATASARRLTAEQRTAAGINENLIRVSVGLEDPDDVAEDLLQAVRA